MGFGELNNIISSLGTGVTGLISALYILAIACGIAGVVILSILMMFSDEQASQRYKRWRMNIIKAVVVAMLIAWVFSIIKSIFGSYWARNNFTDLAQQGAGNH
jgi:NADH:ubiquinone oxidoreductase subunit 6 (subunit J)